MTFGEYFVMLRRRWRVWVAGMLLGLVGAGLVIALSPVKYTAVATSFVTVADVSSGDSTGIFQGSQFTVQRMGSYARLASSPIVLDSVIDELGLTTTQTDLAKMVSVSSPPNTVLVEVSATDSSADRARKVADAVSTRLGSLIEQLETPRGTTESSVKVTLTQPAETPTSPSSPRILLDLAIGLLAGLALGLAAALLRHHLDRRIKSPEAVRAVTGVSPLGSTLFSQEVDKHPLSALDGRSVGTDLYRSLRSSFRFAAVDEEVRQFVVSSAVAGEGKSVVASNLAISWMQAGASVCLVDADLRRPAQARFFGIDGNVGLTDLLVFDVDLPDVLIEAVPGGLTVLPAGSLPPDSAALLGSAAMTDLVAALSTKYDVVIYDSPPVLLVPDAAVLSQVVGAVLLVVRSGRTSIDQLEAALQRIRESKLTLLGTVLAGVKLTARVAHESSYHPVKDVTRPSAAVPPLERATGTLPTPGSRTETDSKSTLDGSPRPEPVPDPADVTTDVEPVPRSKRPRRSSKKNAPTEPQAQPEPSVRPATVRAAASDPSPGDVESLASAAPSPAESQSSTATVAAEQESDARPSLAGRVAKGTPMAQEAETPATTARAEDVSRSTSGGSSPSSPSIKRDKRLRPVVQSVPRKSSSFTSTKPAKGRNRRLPR